MSSTQRIPRTEGRQIVDVSVVVATGVNAQNDRVVVQLRERFSHPAQLSVDEPPFCG